MKFKITVQNYNSESLAELEIFQIFQLKVERAPHFTRFSEIVHMDMSENSGISLIKTNKLTERPDCTNDRTELRMVVHPS